MKLTSYGLTAGDWIATTGPDGRRSLNAQIVGCIDAESLIAQANYAVELHETLRALVGDMNALVAFPLEKLRAARAVLAKVDA